MRYKVSISMQSSDDSFFLSIPLEFLNSLSIYDQTNVGCNHKTSDYLKQDFLIKCAFGIKGLFELNVF